MTQNQIEYFTTWIASLFQGKEKYVIYLPGEAPGEIAGYLCEVKPGEYLFNDVPEKLAARFTKRSAKKFCKQINATGDYAPCTFAEIEVPETLYGNIE